MILCHCRQSAGMGGEAETLRQAITQLAHTQGLTNPTEEQLNQLLTMYYTNLRHPEKLPHACGCCRIRILTLLRKQFAPA